MQNQIAANDFATELAAFLARIWLDDWVWRCFGFKRMPRRGSLWNRFVDPERLSQEQFLLQETLVVLITELARALREIVPEPLNRTILAKCIELLVDGERGNEEVWRSYRFASRQAAQQYIAEGIKSYRRAGRSDYSKEFVQRMTVAVNEKTRNRWIVPAAKLFTEMESPIVNFFQVVNEGYHEYEVTGRISLRDGTNFDIATEGIGPLKKKRITESEAASEIIDEIFEDIDNTYPEFVESLKAADPSELLEFSSLYDNPEDSKMFIATSILFINQAMLHYLLPADQANRLSTYCLDAFVEEYDTWDKKFVETVLRRYHSVMVSPPIPPPPENPVEPLAVKLYQQLGIKLIYSEELDEEIPSPVLITVISEYLVSFMGYWERLLDEYEIILDEQIHE